MVFWPPWPDQLPTESETPAVPAASSVITLPPDELATGPIASETAVEALPTIASVPPLKVKLPRAVVPPVRVAPPRRLLRAAAELSSVSTPLRVSV